MFLLSEFLLSAAAVMQPLTDKPSLTTVKKILSTKLLMDDELKPIVIHLLADKDPSADYSLTHHTITESWLRADSLLL